MAKKRQPPRNVREAEEKRRTDADALAAAKRVFADPTKQAPNNSYGPPVLFYEGIPITCSQCGHQEVWTTRQQK